MPQAALDIFENDLALKDGRIIDKRFLSEFEPGVRYKPEEVAKKLSCSLATVYLLCNRSGRRAGRKEVDPRHFEDFNSEVKYHDVQIARKLRVSNNLIYKLRFLGDLKTIDLISSSRIPGWSVIDFISANASPNSHGEFFDFVSIGKCLRIPGWAMNSYIMSHCSYS